MSLNHHDARVDRLLRRVHGRFFKGSDRLPNGTPVTWENPLDELIAKEESARREASVEVIDELQQPLDLELLPEPIAALIRAKVFEAFREYEETLLAWLFDESPHPMPVLRRLYCYARKKNARLLWNMSYRDLGELFDLSYETLRIETKKHFGDLPGGATKNATARRHMAAAARGNKSRKGGAKIHSNPPTTTT